MRLLRRLLIVVFVLAAIAAVALWQGWEWAKERYLAPGPHTSNVVILIKPGSSLPVIIEQLRESGVFANPDLDGKIFEGMLRLNKQAGKLKAGEFEIPALASMADIADILTQGKTVVWRVTFAEGLTSAEMIAVLNAQEGLSGHVSDIPPEGNLLPETYHFSLNDSRQEIVARMQANMQEILSELWEKRAEDLPLKTPEEAVILASIVEKETGVASERGLVASVFINRLNRGMKLQSDPTTIYGLAPETGDLGRRLTRKDLQSETPYNTYVIPALPVGPICNPGIDSLKAVLNPPESDYFYFVADGTGGHAFGKTLAEHNRNVRSWRKIRDQ